MSNALAIAAVTRLLKDLLNDAFVQGDVAADVETDVIVTALPPDRVIDAAANNQPTQLNVFLHRVTPNPALANADLPTRDSEGRLVQRPRLALDLHYLLTVYADQELHAEILLGYAMELLHENPILARGVIRSALTNGVNGSMLPQAFQSAAASQLADQLELIKIAPQTLSMDDMSKLWTALQTNYRTTVAYMVSVVLIEREIPARTPLPVLSRGPVDAATGRDAGVITQPSLLPPVPTLCAVTMLDEQPAARLGGRIRFTGFHLDDGEARALFTNPETGEVIEMAPAHPPTPDRMEIVLPAGAPLPGASPLAGTGNDPGVWRIGPYSVRLRFRAAGEPERVTNSLPVVLAPRITPSAVPAGSDVQVNVPCEPRIRAGQSVTVVVGRDETPVETPAADVDSVSITRDDLVSGSEHPVRLRVAGIDSLLIDATAEPPGYDPTQLVQIP